MTVDFAHGLAGVPVAQSRIGLIDGNAGQLWYRGYAVEELAGHADFEEVCYLLVRGHLPTVAELDRFRAELRARRALPPRILALLATLPVHGHPIDALAAAIAALGMDHAQHLVDDPEQRWDAVTRLVSQAATVVAAFHRLSTEDAPVAPRDDLGHAENFLYMLSGEVPDPLVARVMDGCLILHAEHGLNASTFSARVTASTLADPYSVVCSAIGTLSGPLHGGANEDVLGMLRSIPGGVAGVRAYAEEAIRNNRKFAGFGHRIYKVKDPRAKILQRLAASLFERFGTTPLYDVACELEQVLGERIGAKGVYPNVDFYSGIVYEKLGIPATLLTPIYAVARTAGWLAHWMEQLEDNRIYRPEQVYTGDRGLRYVPIEQRS